MAEELREGRTAAQLTLHAWIDRDLSWLEFNRRVLQEALDERTPLLERVKFLAIFSANLDEFFMKRIAIIRPMPSDTIPVARARRDLWDRVRATIVPMLAQQAACFSEVIRPRLAGHGIHLAAWRDLTAVQREESSAIFDRDVWPVLTPLGLDAAHPFPYVSNLSTSWAFQVGDPEGGEPVLVRVKVPPELPQWLPLGGETGSSDFVFVGLDEVIAANAARLFPGMEIETMTLFRVCRDAEVEPDGDNGELSKRALVERELAQRRFEPVVRLEVQPDHDPRLTSALAERFGLTPEDVYEVGGVLDYTTLFEIAGLDVPALRDPPWSPLPPIGIEPAPADIFAAIRAGDILLHHPYDSFDDGVERFIRDAADDPATLSIKMTAYRLGDDTPFVESLMRAAQAGKQVACVIELNARFDEKRNIHWSRELEQVGAHVIFGVEGLKTHSKTALVVRQEDGHSRCYAHIATGNYHVRTARIYEDIGLLTADPVVTRDVVALFHFLTGHSAPPSFPTLLVAPSNMRARFVELVEREIENMRAGRPARIVGKMNQLEDADMCLLLCEASEAGVPIDLVVRGLCCLRPGLPGWSENIRVRSIVGRFLEHSRIFHFAAGSDDPEEGEFLIGSADWMHRNLSSRIEAVVPIRDRRLRARLWEILQLCLADRRAAWELQPDGDYVQLQPDPEAGAESESAQTALMRIARARR
jgi:polyphosphate kinase